MPYSLLLWLCSRQALSIRQFSLPNMVMLYLNKRFPAQAHRSAEWDGCSVPWRNHKQRKASNPFSASRRFYIRLWSALLRQRLNAPDLDKPNFNGRLRIFGVRLA